MSQSEHKAHAYGRQKSAGKIFWVSNQIDIAFACIDPWLDENVVEIFSANNQAWHVAQQGRRVIVFYFHYSA